MKDQNAFKLLAEVMGWKETNEGDIGNQFKRVSRLQILADFKFDSYQRYGPGMRFMERLALWLNQFDVEHRDEAFKFVEEQLVFITEKEMSHYVKCAFYDIVIHRRLAMVAEEMDVPRHDFSAIMKNERYQQLQHKSLYLGLSDGARTNEFRRYSEGEISNEQIWQAYELGDEKALDMISSLGKAVPSSLSNGNLTFAQIWLLDDFSGSGNTYIRYDQEKQIYKGKIPKIYRRLHESGLVDPNHYEVFLLLYVATQQAYDHISYWASRFTSDSGYTPMKLEVVMLYRSEFVVSPEKNSLLEEIINNQKYVDLKFKDEHFAVGGSLVLQRGFANCSLPVVLSHNTPNNSVYILWGPDNSEFIGLFPRVSRHRGH